MSKAINGLEIKLSPEVIELACTNVRKVLESGKMLYNEFIPKFKFSVAAMTGMPSAALFASNTAAHEILFHALKLSGRRVVFQANSFPSIVFAANRVGLEPIFCDINPWTTDIDLDQLERLLKSNSIKAVHITSSGGQLHQKTKELSELVHKYGAYLIDDSAHSFCSKRGKVVSGGYADFSIFSFSATKVGGFGVGGMMVGRYTNLVERCDVLARYGKKPYFGNAAFEHAGFSLRLSEISAAVGLAVLSGISDVIKRRQEIANMYIEGLKDSGLHLYDYGESNFYKFPVLLPTGLVDPFYVHRENFRQALMKKGINLSANCVDSLTCEQPIFGDRFNKTLNLGDLNGTGIFCGSHACLPMHEWLSDEDVQTVIAATKEIIEEFREC